jgi:hypothetical protein
LAGIVAQRLHDPALVRPRAGNRRAHVERFEHAQIVEVALYRIGDR